MKFTKLITIVIISLAMLAVYSCKQKNVKKIMVQNQFALSLFRDTIFMDELFDKMDSTTINWLRVNDDGTLCAFYHDTINGVVKASDFMTDIDDVNFNESVSFELETIPPVPVPAVLEDSVSYSVDVPFSYEDYSIESVILNEGKLTVKLTVLPTLPLIKKVMMSSSAITLATGNKLTFEFYPSTSTGPMVNEVDLAGCTIQVNENHEIPFVGEIYVEYDAQVGVLGGVYVCAIDGSLSDLSFKQLTGTLNLPPYDFSDRTPIDFGIEGLTGEVYLPTPTLDLAYRNTFGFGATADINELTFYSEIQNDSVDLIDNGNSVNVSVLESDEFVDQPITGYNTQINVFGQYSELRFGGYLMMNSGNTVTVNDDSEIDLAVGVEMPLEFNIANLRYSDTLDFSASGENNFDMYLDSINFFLDFYNKLPLNVTIDVELLSEGQHSLTLFSDDGSHHNTIISGGSTTLECDVRYEDLQSVLNSDQIVITMTVTTNGMQTLNTHDYVKVGVRMLTFTNDIDVDDVL